MGFLNEMNTQCYYMKIQGLFENYHLRALHGNAELLYRNVGSLTGFNKFIQKLHVDTSSS